MYSRYCPANSIAHRVTRIRVSMFATPVSVKGSSTHRGIGRYSLLLADLLPFQPLDVFFPISLHDSYNVQIIVCIVLRLTFSQRPLNLILDKFYLTTIDSNCLK